MQAAATRKHAKMIKAKQSLRVLRDWSCSSRLPRRKSAPSATRLGNRKLSRPRIVPGGASDIPASLSTPLPFAVLCIRGAQGDSSRYSLLMGVLFSGAPGPPETCHASLSPWRVSRRTMLDTDNAVRMSKISPEVRESHVCAFRFPLRALAVYAA